MSQCTHVIVFNSTNSKDLPSEIAAYPQIRVVTEAWVSTCIKNHSLIDETPYLIKTPSTSAGNYLTSHSLSEQFSYHTSNTNFVYEWEKDIRASVNYLFEGSSVSYSSVFKVPSFPFVHPQKQRFLFLPSLDQFYFLSSIMHSQESFFLSCSVEKMGGKVLTYLSSFEETIQSCIPPRNTQDLVTHIICPYLRHGQRTRLQRALGNYSVAILSSNWLYSCIDQYTYLQPHTSNLWNSLLFTPAIEYSSIHGDY